MSFFEKLLVVAEPIALHFFGMCLTVISIWAFQFLLKLTLGDNAMLFGRLPIEHLAHVGDLTVFLRFIWSAVKEFKNV